jgi:phage FluMu protein Com
VGGGPSDISAGHIERGCLEECTAVNNIGEKEEVKIYIRKKVLGVFER